MNKKTIIIVASVIGALAIGGTIYYIKVVKPKKPKRDRTITLVTTN